MEFFRGYIRQMGFYIYLVLLSYILSGCGDKGTASADTPVSTYDTPVATEEVAESDINEATEETEQSLYEFAEGNLIKWEQVKELETEDYYIVNIQKDDENGGVVEYPQIVLKEGKDIFCGTEHINDLLRRALYQRDYNILYADEYYISLWYGDEETGKTDGTYVINMQCLVTESFITMADTLISIQDDNDYKYAPWPSNGITLSLETILEEIEKGSYYTDETGYALYQEDPKAFIASVRRQFGEIEEGGYEEAYWARSMTSADSESKKAYRMYIREGRVGFYIHPMDVWEDVEGKVGFYMQGRNEPIDTDYDFRVEVAYDWQKDAPVYHMPYEVYGERVESETYGTYYYPQIKGLDENITSALNVAMKQDLDENLVYMDLDAWNEIMKPYGHEQYWKMLPPVNNPMVTYQTEKYLCIRQEFITGYADALRFAEDWKRYHVYDLETGESLQLEDIICLDEEFVMWLKEEKKVEARRIFPGWHEGMGSINDTVNWMKEDLEFYPMEILLSVLTDTEFWLKDGNLYIRIPYYNEESGKILYLGGGNDHPNYIDYAEVRIALTDLQEFLKVEPWGE